MSFSERVWKMWRKRWKQQLVKRYSPLPLNMHKGGSSIVAMFSPTKGGAKLKLNL